MFKYMHTLIFYKYMHKYMFKLLQKQIPTICRLRGAKNYYIKAITKSDLQ